MHNAYYFIGILAGNFMGDNAMWSINFWIACIVSATAVTLVKYTFDNGDNK